MVQPQDVHFDYWSRGADTFDELWGCCSAISSIARQFCYRFDEIDVKQACIDLCQGPDCFAFSQTCLRYFFFFLLCIPTVAGGKSYAHETELQMQPYFTCHRKQNIHLFHSELMVKHFVANEWCLIALLAGGCLQILIAWHSFVYFPF